MSILYNERRPTYFWDIITLQHFEYSSNADIFENKANVTYTGEIKFIFLSETFLHKKQ